MRNLCSPSTGLPHAEERRKARLEARTTSVQPFLPETETAFDSQLKEALMTVLLDPTSERSPTIRPRLPRPERLDGLTIGILDIAKPRGDVFLHRLGERFAARRIAGRHYAKPTTTRVSPVPLRQQIAAEVDLGVQGLSD